MTAMVTMGTDIIPQQRTVFEMRRLIGGVQFKVSIAPGKSIYKGYVWYHESHVKLPTRKTLIQSKPIAHWRYCCGR